jgi:hypothetical protein
MTKERIMEALQDDDLKRRLLEELEVEELEDRAAAKPWICYRPAIP